MKIKYYKFAYALAALMGLSSCGDFLEIEPQDKIILDKFWNERSDVESVVNTCYASLQSSACIKRMIVWGEGRSETMTAGNNINKDLSLENVFKADLNSTNAYTSWVDFYYVINTCNTVIRYAPQVAEKDPGYTQGELKAHIAEMTALRALCYFYLIRTFRDVPYTTDTYTDDDQEMALPATPFETILDNLIADLERVQDDAVKYYPKTQPLYQTGRITQNAIHAMLCEMYLWKQDYQQCINYADRVIKDMTDMIEENRKESGSRVTVDEDMEGYPLTPTRSSGSMNLFGAEYSSIFGTGNDQETIFELVFMKNDDTQPANGAIADFYGNSVNQMGFISASSYVGGDVLQKQYKVYANQLDARCYESVNTGLGTYSIGKYACQNCIIGVTGTTAASATVDYMLMGYYPEKHVQANWIVYRLTDIMLMKAEALSQLMSDGVADGTDPEQDALDKDYRNQAFRIVSVINKRALCQYPRKDILKEDDYKTKSDIENLVLDERRRELMFEGKRWYDLVRRSRRDGNTDYLRQQSTAKYSSNKSLVESKLTRMEAIYWPYNNDELKVNPFLVQNPAFGTGLNDSYEQAK